MQSQNKNANTEKQQSSLTEKDGRKPSFLFWYEITFFVENTLGDIFEKTGFILLLKDSQKRLIPVWKNLNVDILIVGGGITGILCAYQLAKQNKYRIALVEKNRLYHSTTGFTTGKVTVQHDDIYHQLIKNKGETIARAYYQANSEAVQGLKKIVEEENIDCDWVDTKAILYAFSEEEAKRLQREQNAYDTLGIPYEWLDKETLPFKTLGGLAVPDQGVFHIVRFLDGILNNLNVDIYEKTKIIKTNPTEKGAVAETADHYKISASISFLRPLSDLQKVQLLFHEIKPTCSYVAIDPFAINRKCLYQLNRSGIVNQVLGFGGPHHGWGFGHDVKTIIRISTKFIS